MNGPGPDLIPAGGKLIVTQVDFEHRSQRREVLRPFDLSPLVALTGIIEGKPLPQVVDIPSSGNRPVCLRQFEVDADDDVAQVKEPRVH